MNQDEGKRLLTIAAVENARLLLDRWAASLAQVMESMTDQKPEVRWQPGSGPDPGQEILWWEQPFQLAPGMTVWVAAPRATWEYAGTLTLKAAGLETVEPAEARSTWLEILGQSLAAMAGAMGLFLGHEVKCEAGSERAPSASLQDWVSALLIFKEGALAPLSIAFSPQLLSLMAAPIPARLLAAPEPEARQAGRETALSPTMDLLMDVELPVSISFGKAQLPMKDVLKLTTGSIVELNRGVNETVDVLVNHRLIARGEVVVVDGNYGVRIQQIASPQDRLRTVR